MDTREAARSEVPALAESELFVAGVAYWAEGVKNKPWRSGESVRFVNSDPAMIRLFLAWARLIDIADDRLLFRVHIHESGDVAAAVRFWAEVIGVPADVVRTTLKRHNPTTHRKNTADDYHGCLSSTYVATPICDLQIAGWFEGVAEGAVQ